MATKDVFGGLNDFLNKDSEDSLVYDLSESLETSIPIPASTQKLKDNQWDELSSPVDAIDLINLTSHDKKTSPSRKTRRADALDNPESSFDLTSESLEISPPKRSRRAADGFENGNVVTVELEDNGTELNVSSGSTGSVKKGRGRPRKGEVPIPKAQKAPKPPKQAKPKRVTVKQALALAKAPIPELPTPAAPVRPVPTTISPRARRSINRASQSICDVDLTGDVVLTDKHSSAPLFQKQPAQQSAASKVIDDSKEEDLLEMDMDALKIKVKTKDAIKSYSHRRHQRYYDLFKAISEELKVSVSCIFLFDGTKRINPEDTPHQTEYRISTILSCRVMESKATESAPVRKDLIEIKMQSDKWKKPIVIKMSKIDNFKTAIQILCEQVQFKPEQISLSFDGDEVNLTETPMDLDFDGGECLDCKIKA